MPLSQRDLIQRIDFASLLTDCGFEDVDPGKEKYLGSCVFHNDQRTKSFSANLDLKLFHCFSAACGVAGNAIHLYALCKNITYEQSIEELSERFASEIKPRSLEALTMHVSVKKEWAATAEIFTEMWKACPAAVDVPEVRDYLENRKLLSVAEQFGVKASVAEVVLPPLAKKFGVAELMRAGVLAPFSTEERWAASFHSPAVFIPLFLGSKVVYYQTRALQADINPKYLNPSGIQPPCLYRHDALLSGKDVVYVAEGPLDTLSLEVLGYSPAVGLIGTESFLDEWLPDFRCRKVVLCLDVDKAGSASAQELGLKFVSRGIDVSLWEPPVGIKDVNELLKLKSSYAR